MEIVNGVEITYLYANGQPFGYHKKNGSNETINYLHLDYQGSIMAITDQSGIITEEHNYDAWGRARDPQKLYYTTINPFGSGNDLRRGYTFHEHLEEFNLINMNGRMYDPLLARFLNADPLLQDNTDAQNYNRYSYVLNNPTKYTDPSGYVYTNYNAIRESSDRMMEAQSHEMQMSFYDNLLSFFEMVKMNNKEGGSSDGGGMDVSVYEGGSPSENDPVDPPTGTKRIGWPTNISGVGSVRTSGVAKNAQSNVTGGRVESFGIAFAFGGGYSVELGNVYDSKGNSKTYFSHGPVLGLTLSAGYSSKSIRPTNNISYKVNDYKGYASGYSLGLLLGGVDFSGNRGNTFKMSDFKLGKGEQYNQLGTGVFTGLDFGVSWSRTYTSFFD
jgi:RHS repeat-associated protein